jgi:hypothetical protein
MTCLLFIDGVTNKGNFLRANIGILCYLTTFFSNFVLSKLEHGQFQAFK